MNPANDGEYEDSNKTVGYWIKLAKVDPERLEREKRELVEAVISGGNREKLEALQWRIDAEIMRAKTPIDSMLRLSKMMWNQFYAERGFLFAVNQLVSSNQRIETQVKKACEKKDAVILPFINK